MVTFVWRNGKVVDKAKAGPRHSGNSAAYVISDTMDPTLHHADCKMYTSKKKFRDATRAAGLIEYGNDLKITPRKIIPMDPAKRRDDIRRTIYDLRNGRR